MNIVFISSLYPVTDDPDEVEVTRALHQLVKQWISKGNTRVRVVRPVYIYLKEILLLKHWKSKKSIRKKTFTLDGVEVLVYPVFKIPKIAYFYYPLVRYLNKLLKRRGFEPDLVVAHYDKSLEIGDRCARKYGIPLVAGLHITPDLMTEDAGPFTRRCGPILERAALIACRSGYIYNKINRWFPSYREKSFVAFSGIEASLIEPLETATNRMKLWKTSERPQLSIITVSSLIERKKIDTVLKALAQMKDRIDWTYTVIGEGEERSRLEALAQRLGIRERVSFPGNMPHRAVITSLKRAHIFVLTSYLETFGLVYLEAMASGTIVIGARDEGIDGVIVHRKNGYLSPAGEVPPLREIFEEIILHSSVQQLETLLVNAYSTIVQYTDREAGRNYLERLEAV